MAQIMLHANESIVYLRRATYSILSFLLLVPAVPSAQQPPKLLDLTTPPPEQKALGVPGTGISSLQPRARYELPVSIHITSVRRQHRTNEFVIELRLTNLGQTALDVPIDRNDESALQDSNLRRRSWGLHVDWKRRDGTTVDGGGELLAGTDSNPKSFSRLDPEQTLIVRLPGQLPPAFRGSVTLSIRLTENKYQDGEYQIATSSKTVRSENTIEVEANPR